MSRTQHAEPDLTAGPGSRETDGRTAERPPVVRLLATPSLAGPFYQPGDLVLSRAGSGTQLTYTEPRTAHDALPCEAAEVARCFPDEAEQRRPPTRT
ncbi:hypothetical protein ACWCRD_29290 [Streptomyces sp. NPDC002092]